MLNENHHIKVKIVGVKEITTSHKCYMEHPA